MPHKIAHTEGKNKQNANCSNNIYSYAKNESKINKLKLEDMQNKRKKKKRMTEGKINLERRKRKKLHKFNLQSFPRYNSQRH